jgi:sec-independent protein translocase protein TatB
MGNLGWTEMVFIAVIALMVFGPKRLPEMGRKLGRIMGQLRQASDQFKQVWDSEVEKVNLKEMQQKVQENLSPDNLLSSSSSTKTNDDSNSIIEPANQPSFTEEANSSSTDSPSGLTDAELARLNEGFLSPPLGATIERSKPSFDLTPTTPETIAQVEETQPISLSKN